MEISSDIKGLSTQGIINILKEHITLIGDETREELEQILQINLDDEIIDEIYLILELSGE